MVSYQPVTQSESVGFFDPVLGMLTYARMKLLLCIGRAVENYSGPIVGWIAVADHQSTVNENMRYPFRVLFRPFICRLVGHCARIKHDKVSLHAGPYQTTVEKTKTIGGQR